MARCFPPDPPHVRVGRGSACSAVVEPVAATCRPTGSVCGWVDALCRLSSITAQYSQQKDSMQCEATDACSSQSTAISLRSRQGLPRLERVPGKKSYPATPSLISILSRHPGTARDPMGGASVLLTEGIHTNKHKQNPVCGRCSVAHQCTISTRGWSHCHVGKVHAQLLTAVNRSTDTAPACSATAVLAAPTKLHTVRAC